MKLYQFQIKKTVASLVILATVFLIVAAFQNCGEVRISGRQGPSTDLPSTPPEPAKMPATEALVNPFVNCIRTWKQIARSNITNVGSGYFEPIVVGNFAYFSKGLGDIQKYDLTSGTIVAEFRPAQLLYQSKLCNYSTSLDQTILDSKRNKLLMKVSCNLSPEQSFWPIIFEIDATTMQVTDAKNFVEVLGNFVKSKSGDIFAETGTWNASRKKYCVKLFKHNGTVWALDQPENCDTIFGTLVINSRDELFNFNRQDQSFYNFQTGDISTLPSSNSDISSNATSDLIGNLYFSVFSWLPYTLRYYKYDRALKQILLVSTRTDVTTPNVHGFFNYVNNGTFIDYFSKNAANVNGYTADLQTTSVNLNAWTHLFESSYTYQSTAGPAKTYLSPTGITVQPSGDIYFAGKLFTGTDLINEYWRYTCN